MTKSVIIGRMSDNVYDNRPIGVFDSGLGGLTVVKEIQNQLPHESILYLGDTARVPYGNRSKETIIDFSREIVEFLLTHDVKAIVIACATASSAAAEQIRQEFPQLPIFDVIEPFNSWKILEQSSVGILGTRATIHAGKLAAAIRSANQNCRILEQACPLLVPLIEEGITDGVLIQETLALYLSHWAANTPDYIVLGCTHYPILSSAINNYLPSAVIINPGELLAKHLKMLTPHNDSGTSHRYFVTDLSENFQATAHTFLDAPIHIEKVTFGKL